MRRREFIAAISATIAYPPYSHAQQPGSVRRVGVLMAFTENDPDGKAQLSGFVQELAELGWLVGRNLRMEVRWGGSDVTQIGIFAKELLGLQPDLIVTQGTPATAALHQQRTTVPIVFVVVTDPVGHGFVSNLAVPGGNITGFLTSEAGMGSKLLELLLAIAPDVQRVGMLFNPDTAPGGGAYYFEQFEAAARSSKVEPIAARAKSDAEIESLITSFGREPGGGLVVMPDFFMLNHVKPIISQSARNKVPAVYPWRVVVTRDGALLSYGPDLADIVRRGANYVDRVLRGAKPANLPVQVPVKFDMAVNVKAAKALGLTVPTSILLSANEVIE